MMKFIPYKLLFLTFIFLSGIMNGQDSSKKKKFIPDIPHKTLWQKYMWPHRLATYFIIKEKPKTYDTTYIKSYSNRLIITIPVSARLMHFDIINPGSNKYLQYAPNYRYDVGIGISSKWATFITNTGIVFFNSRNNERGVTRYNDFQINLYGKRFTSDITYQHYKGFYVANSQDFNYNGSGPFEVRSDIKATLFVNSTYYIFNSKKFSYRNSFAFTETQLKSCGSFLLGPYYSLFGVKADSSIISKKFAPYFDTLSNIIEGSVQSFGISAGYIHTFVHHKAYATISIVPGAGLDITTYDRTDNTTYKSGLKPAGKINFRVGLGYDTGTLYIGVMGVYDYFNNLSETHHAFNYSTGKALGFVGYRFKYNRTERKILRRLSLIDYPGDPRNQ
jgi:hypothetical protein